VSRCGGNGRGCHLGSPQDLGRGRVLARRGRDRQRRDRAAQRRARDRSPCQAARVPSRLVRPTRLAGRLLRALAREWSARRWPCRIPRCGRCRLRSDLRSSAAGRCRLQSGQDLRVSGPDRPMSGRGAESVWSRSLAVWSLARTTRSSKLSARERVAGAPHTGQLCAGPASPHVHRGELTPTLLSEFDLAKIRRLVHD
jgi:hypothetical protein